MMVAPLGAHSDWAKGTLMYRAIIAVVIVAVLGFGGYLLYQQFGEPSPGTGTGQPEVRDETTGKGTGGSTIASPQVDVDALLARLPQGSKGSYAKKSYDQGTGITTIEGLELTFDLPQPPPPPAPPPGVPPSPPELTPQTPPELTPQTPGPTPQTPQPPDNHNGSLETSPRFGAAESYVRPVNLAPPDFQERPEQPVENDQQIPPPDGFAPPPFPDPLDPLSSLPTEMPEINIKSLRVTIDRTQLRGLDVDAFESVFDPKRYTAQRDETFRTLFDTVTLNGVKIFADGKQIGSVTSADGRGLLMKQFAFLPGGVDFEKQFVSQETMGFQIVGMVADSLKLDALAIKDFKIFSNEPGEQFEYGWANYTVGKIDRGRLGPTHADSLTFKIQDNTNKIAVQGTEESQDSEGADFSGVLPYMIKGEMPPVTATKLISIGAGRAKNLKYEIPTVGEYLLSDVASEPVLFEWLIPSQLKFTAKGNFKVDASTDPATADLLKQLEQSDFPFDLTFAWKYEGLTGNAQLDTFAINMAGLYGIDFGIGLTGLKLSEFATEEQMNKMTGELMFTGLRLVITDAGGTKKAVKIFAQESQITEDQARESLKQQAIDMAASDPGDPTAAAVANAVAQFIQNPGKLSLTAIPAQPVPFMMLMIQSEDPATLSQTLNIKVEASPPPP